MIISNRKIRKVFLILLIFTSSLINLNSANAAWIQYQSSPADTYNRPDLPAEYDIIRTDFGVFDANSDEYWFFLAFAKPVTQNLFSDNLGSWAGILIDINNDNTIDYSLQTDSKPYSGNFYKPGRFLDRTSATPVESSKCSVQTWTNLDKQATWIGFSIKKNCLNFGASIGVQGYSDYISQDEIGYDYAPDSLWKLNLTGGSVSSSGNSSSSTVLGDLPSLNQLGITEITNPSNQPNDLVSLAAQTTKSVVTVLCGDGLGSGWAIEVSLSNSNLANGYKSYVITNHHVIASCTSNRNITLVLSDQTRVSGFVYTWDEANDVAGILTTTNLQGLNWRGPTPQQGWWVGVLGSPLGFPGILTSGIVSSVYPNTFLGTTTSAINPGNSGGPVFDRTGRVIGLATAKYVGSEGFGIFHGTPLLCGKILNCSDKNLVWTNTNGNSSTVNNTNSNSTYNSSEYSKAILDSYSAFQMSVNSCVSTANTNSISVSKYLKLMQLGSKCIENQIEAKNYLDSAQKIMTKTVVSKAELEQYTSYVDKLNALSEYADSTNAAIQDAVTGIDYALFSLNDAKTVNLIFNSDWNLLNKRITKLPITTQRKITSTAEYTELKDSRVEWLEFRQKLSDFLESISSSTNAEYILKASDELRNIEPSMLEDAITFNIRYLSKLIPKYVCQKGKDVIPLTSSTCKSGYKKVTT